MWVWWYLFQINELLQLHLLSNWCMQMAVELEVQDVVEEEGGEASQSQAKEINEREQKRSRKTTYFYYLGLVVVVIGFASCVLQLQFHGIDLLIC